MVKWMCYTNLKDKEFREAKGQVNIGGGTKSS